MPVIKPVFIAIASAPIATGGVITTSVSPAVSRYYAAIDAGMIGATVTTIPAASFLDDTDGPVTTLPAVTVDDYYNVYINGVLQQGALSTLTTGSLVLATTDLAAGVPVLLEVASFAGATSTLTTPPTISAPTITIIS
ncbi:protein of unknown function [Paenibacillus sp. UNCCL117]|uniref:DUF4183 domain-containing protein n=1 Tax=unclassified Paenibacillus TaxID=185978 RepID=UPI00088B657E|nr:MULTISPECIES: DUF4183 domain-containing protein [unclassified Paenibacillus]SDD17786.1 protein of unknown function [Paenibacillus sp. cl123]SFW35062.1 protein of unknown function [Paenibacillus sp. UNCCL117]